VVEVSLCLGKSVGPWGQWQLANQYCSRLPFALMLMLHQLAADQLNCSVALC